MTTETPAASSLWAVQTAIYTTIKNHTGIIDPVYDHVPAAAVFPYIVIGDIQRQTIDTMDGNHGDDLRFTVHFYSRATTSAALRTSMDAVFDALHLQALQIAGFKTVLCRLTHDAWTRHPDGRTRHGVQHYHLIVTRNIAEGETS